MRLRTGPDPAQEPRPEAARPGRPIGERARLLDLLDERMRFEALLVDLSAAFINLPADAVDAQIERGLGRIVKFLGVERGSLGEYAEDGRQIRITHSYAEPGFPPIPSVALDELWPWYAEQLRRGEILPLTRLPDDLPPEAAAEREYCDRSGFKSHLAIPLRIGGLVLGFIGFGSFRAYRGWPDELVPRLRLVGEIFTNALARRRADQELRRSEQHYRELAETTRAVPWELDPGTRRIRYIGPQAVPLLGYPLEDWYGEGSWAAHLHPDDRGRVVGALDDAARRGAGLELDYRMLSASGDEVWLHHLITAPCPDSPTRTLRGVLIDVTARRAAEGEAQRLRDQLARVARAATMGELAAAIAHEINQPLCAIVSNAQAAQRLLAAEAADLAEVRETLRDIAADSRRASAIIARIRTLLQNRPPERAPLDLNDAIREVVALVQHRLTRNGIALTLDLAADVPPVLGDRVQLQQVVLNLLVNAVEALGRVESGPRELSLRSARDGRDAVGVTVGDSGPGLAPGDAERAFDAFFTTKPGGLGIGLAISRSIVAAHGGRIRADPDAGRGTAFHFSLPAAREAPP